MSAYDRLAIDAKMLRPSTQLVHGGAMRSAFGETSEALFLTQGFVYNSAEVAEGRFTGEDEGFQYSRFGNPTVAMFEQRMALLEGAEAARATATGMAAVTTALMGQVRAGDHIVASRALFGSCLYIVQDLLPRFGVESTLVDGRAVFTLSRTTTVGRRVMTVKYLGNETYLADVDQSGLTVARKR